MPMRPVLAAVLIALAAASARAEDPAPKPAPEAAPQVASLEDAKAALERFQEEYRARGLKGDERLAMKELAMRRLAKVQHPLVAERLARLTKESDEDLRTLAVLYLGEQVALPGTAGPLVVAALQKNVTDAVLVMIAGDAIEALDYRGAVGVLRSLLQHKNEAVKKHALTVIGDMKEMRMIGDVLKLMVDLKIDKGVKWEGGEVHVDTGTPGDADQKAAEAAYAAKYGQKAARGKSGGRSMRDMKPVLLDAMRALTGQEFVTSVQAAEWIEAHKAEIEAAQTALDERQKAQEAAAKELAAAATAR